MPGPSRIPRPIVSNNKPPLNSAKDQENKSKIPVAKHRQRPVKATDPEMQKKQSPSTGSPENKKRKVIPSEAKLDKTESAKERDPLLDTSLSLKAVNNRYDKRYSGLDYTYIVYSDVNGVDKNARMLNSVPEKILLKKGIDVEQCREFGIRKKNNPVSDKVFYNAGVSCEDLKWYDGIVGRTLGEGSFGKVKFAEVYDDKKKKAVVVAAKKIKVAKCFDINAVKNELILQNKAGDSALSI